MEIFDHSYDRHIPLPEKHQFFANRVFKPEHFDSRFIEDDALLGVQRKFFGKIPSRYDFQPQRVHKTKICGQSLNRNTFPLFPALFPDGRVVLAVYARDRVHAGDIHDILML